MIFWQFQADGFELRIITAVAFTLERPAIKLGPQSKSQESSLVLVRTKFQPKWYPFGLAVAGNSYSKAYYIAFPWVWTSFAKKNTGIYFDFVETANMRDGWCLWCSICINLNAVFKKCLVISYCPTVSSCVYVYIYMYSSISDSVTS